MNLIWRTKHYCKYNPQLFLGHIAITLINSIFLLTPKIAVPRISPLCSLTADSSGELNVLGHDSHTLSMDGAEVSILKKADQVSLSSLLQSEKRGALESKLWLEVLGDFSDQALERKLSNEQIGRLLIFANLTKCDSSRAITVGLLDGSSTGSWFPRSLHGATPNII